MSTPPPAPIIIWFRQDLRIADNAALNAAAATGQPVIPIFVWDETLAWSPGGASRWWMHKSLESFSESLAALGAPLILRRGPAKETITKLAQESGATAVYWNRCYEPAAIARDTDIKAALRDAGLAVESFNSALLFEPWEIKTQSGTPFRVYTPFAKAAFALPASTPVPAPRKLTPAKQALPSDQLARWKLLPTKPDWAGGFREMWTPGESGAAKRLKSFLTQADRYNRARDIPSEAGTSRLSPHLHWGEIGPRQIWNAIAHLEPSAGTTTFQRELLWREFAHHLLYHFPTLPERPLRPEFWKFPWDHSRKSFSAWQKGQTGYPIVDAGMRELWHTGWMHNRVRMIVASFLVKHLLLPWQEGALWFWDTLVDADLANNSASWQWVAGCGTDAAPFFRIFNPQLQGGKFDAKGAYVRQWVPEIAALPDKYLHEPWEAPDHVLREAGIVLGKTYPGPIVDHAAARARALAAFKSLREDA